MKRRLLCSRASRPSAVDPTFYSRIKASILGVTEETTTGVARLYQMVETGELPFPAINVNDSVTKSKFDNLYGCRESLVDSIKRATDVMVAGKQALVMGYGDVGKGSAHPCAVSVPPFALLRWIRSACRPLWKASALFASKTWWTRWTSSSPHATSVIRHEHLVRMKDEAIVCNIGHFDNEIDVASLGSTSGTTSSRRWTTSPCPAATRSSFWLRVVW